MTMMARLMGTTAAALLASGAVAETIWVTSDAGAGEGSLRAAIAAAARSDTPSRILVATAGDIVIDGTLEYYGAAPLTLLGRGQTIATKENVTLLAVPNGADLTIVGLNFAGPGGFSIENRGDLGGDAGKGVFVGVPNGATGTVRLNMADVVVKGVSNYGVHVSDCSLADACGGGGGGAGDGSAASVSVTFANVKIENVGNGKFDADGLRVNERGAGDIHFTASGSTFNGVGDDGVELDEGQDGDVVVMVSSSVFDANGAYCNPDLLAPFVPDPDEGEFEQGQMAEANVPAIKEIADNSCIERVVDTYDDGSVEAFEFAIDLGDGFDVDEAGAGSVIAIIVGSTINGNMDQGLDYDEEDDGGIDLTVVSTRANGNTDDGYKMSEEGEGDVIGNILMSIAEDNGGKGFVFEEEDGGDVLVVGADVMTDNNDDGDKTGLELVQDDDGMGAASLIGSDIADGVYAEGVDVTED